MKKKTFNIARIILTSIYAFSVGVLIFESCMDGPSSSNHSNVTAGTIAEIVNTIGGDATVEVLPKSLTINNKITTAKVGEQHTLTTTTKPSNASYQSINFTTSDSSVASVNGAGLIKFLKAGKSTISAYNVNYPNIKDSFEVTVSNVEVESITSQINAPVSDNAYTLTVGNTYTISNTITPSNATNKTVTYQVPTNSYISVSDAGKITTISASNEEIIEITAKCGSKTSSLRVKTEIYKVEEIPLTAITTSTTSKTIVATETWAPSFTFTPSNATDKSYTLTSNNTSVASISGKSVKGLKAGSAIITAKSTYNQSITASINLTVNPQPAVTNFSVPSSISMVEGTTRTISISQITPNYANASSKSFSSNNQSVATVNNSGKITAVAPGSAKITVTVGPISKVISITVTAKPAPEIDKTIDFEVGTIKKPIIFAGKSVNITSYYKVDKFVSPDGQYTPPNTTVSFSAVDETLCTVNGNTLTSNYIGNITLYIKHDISGIVKEITFTCVDDFYIDNSNAPAPITLKYSENYNLVIGPSDNTFSKQDGIIESWSVTNGNDSIITVKENGDNYLITGVGEGSSVVTVIPSINGVSYPEAKKTITFNVNHVRTTTFTVTINKTRFDATESQLEQILENYCYINDVLVFDYSVDEGTTLHNVVYESEDPTIASVSNKGVISLKKIGRTIVTATETVTNKKASFIINVQNKVALLNDNPFSVSGVASAFNPKTGYYSIENGHLGKIILNHAEGSTYKSAEWSSSDESVATVGGDGTISPVKAGKTQITAVINDGYSLESVTITVKLEVKKQPVIKDLQEFFRYIRKAVGHFLSFLVFGIFSALTYMMWFRGKKWFWSTPLTFIQAFGLAALTEYIQTFIPGRCGAWSDVWLDSKGAFIGIGMAGTLIILITLLKWYLKKKKTMKKEGQKGTKNEQ